MNLTEEQLAEIFYIFVHDLEIENENSAHLNAIKNILRWAKENEYSTIERHAEKILRRKVD